MSIEDRNAVRREFEFDGALARIELASPKGNILDALMVEGLRRAFDDVAGSPRTKAVLLCAAGPHFSYGASIEEHLPDRASTMLTAFRELLRTIAATGLPVLAAVRGKCLGGGLELVSVAQRIFAHPSASFGQPEIKLGVFAPFASFLLAGRVGRGVADDLLLTGRSMDAEEALRCGLVDDLYEAPEAAARRWCEQHLLAHSAASLRYATRAARLEFNTRFDALVPRLETMYLDDLMGSLDANEGLTAFLEKRPPRWLDR